MVMKSIVPMVMVGVLGIYRLIIVVIISNEINPNAKSYYLFDGYAHPIGGRYYSSKKISQNVELTDPIVSRFNVPCIVKVIRNIIITFFPCLIT